MALEAAGRAGRAQANGKHQGPGAGDCQGDTGGGLPRPAGEVEEMIRISYNCLVAAEDAKIRIKGSVRIHLEIECSESYLISSLEII